MRKIIPFLFLLHIALSGCSVLEGQYYLNKAQYEEGRSVFHEKLARKPDDPRLNYYMARFELGAENPQAALPFIEKAVRFAPNNSEYLFWEGVTWWALMEPDKERAAYEKALALNPRHLPATLYLGHNMLDQGKDARALELYDRVLGMDSNEPQALFNKAVALERLERNTEMREVMLRSLDLYPQGAMSRQGTRMLNRQGDFTWRNHPLGLRTVALKSIEFRPFSASLTEDDQASLDKIGAILSVKQDLNLHVVAYVRGNADLARQRALVVRDFISRTHPKVAPQRLTLSWFGEPEIITIDNRSFTKNESIAIFTKVD